MKCHGKDDGERRSSVKTLLIIFEALLFISALLISELVAKETVSGGYVYLLRVEGGRVYQIAEKVVGNGRETIRKELRRMEMISPGTALEIEKGASAFLTCGGCKVLKLTDKDSPYVVKMGDVYKGESTTNKMMEYFAVALNDFIHPGSKPGSKVHFHTRGDPTKGLCKDLWPPDHSDLMPLDPIIFKWEKKGTRHSLEIRELGNNTPILLEKRVSERIDVPIGIFKPGRRYEWFLSEEETGKTCSATFELLSPDKSKRIMEIINQLPTLLPPEADMETKCRLQAGYFLSEGLDYDAWRWLDRYGISQ
jgi:hypothetical protein